MLTTIYTQSIMFFIDNNAAKVSLLRGVSHTCTRASGIARAFWSVLSHTSLSVWLERIPTKMNEADRPSRTPLPSDAVEFFPDI